MFPSTKAFLAAAWLKAASPRMNVQDVLYEGWDASVDQPSCCVFYPLEPLIIDHLPVKARRNR